MKIVILRHASKLYDNGKSSTNRFDPAIKDTEKERCSQILKRYFIEYSDIKPTRIISSPFLRCRQTAGIIADSIKDKFGESIQVEIDSNLSEFLGFQKDISPGDFHFETYKHSPYGIEEGKKENLNMFQNRVTRFMSDITEENKDKQQEVLWIITHGIFINTFLSTVDIPSERIKYFKGIIIEDDNICFI